MDQVTPAIMSLHLLRCSELNRKRATTVVRTLLSWPGGRGRTVPVTWMTDSTVRPHSAAFKPLEDWKHRKTGLEIWSHSLGRGSKKCSSNFRNFMETDIYEKKKSGHKCFKSSKRTRPGVQREAGGDDGGTQAACPSSALTFQINLLTGHLTSSWGTRTCVKPLKSRRMTKRSCLWESVRGSAGVAVALKCVIFTLLATQ